MAHHPSSHIRIPVALLKNSEGIRLFIYLKFEYDGWCKLNYAKWGRDLGMDRNNVREAAEKLISMGWLVEDGKGKRGYYIRGFKFLMGHKKYRGTIVVLEEVLCKDRWTAFITGTVCEWIKRLHTRKKARFRARPEVGNDRYVRPEWEYQLGGVSLSLIAKFFDISITTAWRWRKMAAKAKYIRIYPRWVDWDMTTRGFLSQKSNNPGFDPSVRMGKDGVIRKQLSHGVINLSIVIK